MAADVNGDGLVDLISANSYNSTLTVLLQIGAIQPRLTIIYAGASAIISWPLMAGFMLQTNANLPRSGIGANASIIFVRLFLLWAAWAEYASAIRFPCCRNFVITADVFWSGWT